MFHALLRADPRIPWRSALLARTIQLLFPIPFYLRYASARFQFARKPIAKPTRMAIPTRHGSVQTLLYSPCADDVVALRQSGRQPPVHLILHGGAFVIRMPEQEDNVARYLASEAGCYVLIPDYDTAPDVLFPVAEQQCYDIFCWIHERAESYGWDGERISVGGASAGSKLAMSVVTQAIDAGGPIPVAVSSEYGTADIGRPDALRPTAKAHPVVAPWLSQLVRQSYYSGANLADALVSPVRYSRLAAFPPTLILTAEYDTLRHELHAMARDLIAHGVCVTQHEFLGVDHGFTHNNPVEYAHQAMSMIAAHLSKAYGLYNS